MASGSDRGATPDRFDSVEADAYKRWRDAKLARYPRTIDELLVELRDPLALTASERAAILDRCARANMALYVARLPDDEEVHRNVALGLARQLGLRAVEDHRSRDGDGMVRIELAQSGGRVGYIPYTDRPIAWHTDGYYNFHGPDRAVVAMTLHCARAADGGENGLLDHEIAYLRLRDENPAHVEALSRGDAMTIPANVEADGRTRPENVGPVFFVGPRHGRLCMRYTARTRSVAWRDDEATRAATGALRRILESDPLILRARLAPGMGLICNNVLHDRTGFKTPAAGGRLLYRIRHHDLIA